ncbi:hypothetical protein QAA18_08595 [Luteimonas sp. 8-5]|uniref:hypothetical protein n=1 Tax=Luteimonas sp. 8-5 TaxID=3039387 RepID=UPI0024366276|nr:hypothetical protein [Luteimonas sp. 8-5]MDG6348791.1 hypothetical protein [Luteimonas sp. 8-5]
MVGAALPFVLVCLAWPAYGQEVPDSKQCVPQDDSQKVDPQAPDCSTQQQSTELYDPQTALMTVVEPKVEADTTRASPLGDDYDPVTGAVTFSTTDISIPGNFPIPVELRRWVPREDYDTGGPTGWAWNIPFIKGNYLDVKDGHSDTGWDWGLNTWHDGYNCSGDADQAVDAQGEPIAPSAYWSGKLLHIPGVTSETFLTKTDGTQLTKSNFRIASCIINPDGQEGIVVAGPDGLTYTFNQIKSYYNGKPALKDPIVRTRLLMVTKIEDRFGNHVDYSYTNGELTGITASDGRSIAINYALAGSKRRPTTATAHGRTWTYAYAGSGFSDKLTTVTLPDGVSTWTYSGVEATAFDPMGSGGYSQQFRIFPQPVLVPGCTVASTQYVATVKTPHGLTSTYTFKDVVLYRANVEPELYQDTQNPDLVLSRTLYCTVRRALVAKAIAGPGIPTANWTYAYSTNTGTYTDSSDLNDFLTGPFVLPVPAVGGYPEPVASGDATEYRSTTVTGPERKLVFYIDRTFQSLTENRVVAQDTLNAAGNTLLQRTQSVFDKDTNPLGMHWYRCPCDGLYPPVNEVQLSYRIHQIKSIDNRYLVGGVDTYTTESANFDSYGFALTSKGWNSIAGLAGMQQIDRTYLHDTVNGLIGLPLTETASLPNQPDPRTTVVLQHHYNSLGQLDWTKSFGKLKATLTYDNSASVASGQRGTLKTVKDGNDNVSTLSSWKRGTPQLVQFADSTSRSGVVDNNGWLTETTDENGYTTSYTYDAMGQLTGIVRPTGDSTTWETTTRSFAPVSTTEYGLAAGHFRESISTGNARKLVYYDALLRPRVIREYDAANEAATKRFQRFDYDLEGRTTFAAYPGTSDTLGTGTWTEYDALGRVTSVAQDTELSPSLQVTTTQYLSGARVRTTSPLGQQTTTTYMAYGQPSMDWPVLIQAPEGVTTTIVRDAFGKPESITRGEAP